VKARPLRAPLARAIRSARKAAGVSQGELARRLGCDQGRVSRIESGKQGVSLERAVRFSIALGTTVEGILARVDGYHGLVARELRAMGGREHLQVDRLDGRTRVKRGVTFDRDAGDEW
jgi:transcriptional regulator with XRE-family HTH domain